MGDLIVAPVEYLVREFILGVARRGSQTSVRENQADVSVRIMPMSSPSIGRNGQLMHLDRQFGFATRAIHAGTPPDPSTGSRAAPIYQTAAYVFGSTEQAAELFQLRSYGHIYSRISNPTVAAFEERMASLEGALGGVAFSSGLAAQLCAVLALAQSGDHVISSQNIYGGTVTQFTVTLRRMGIECSFAPVDDFDALRAAIRPNTKLLFAETIGNPS